MVRQSVVREWRSDLPGCSSAELTGTIFDDLDQFLSRLPSAERIDLSKCALTETPDLSHCTSLVELLLSENDFRDATFVSLGAVSQTLYRLDLSSCALDQLPHAVTTLSELGALDISLNQIDALPAELGSMTSLDQLDLTGLVLPKLVETAAHLGTDDLKSFLRQMGPHPFECREGKLLVLGEGNVGKSSLVASLALEPFVDGLPTTHGIEVTRIVLEDDGDTAPEVTAWDFGGQKIYRVTHPFFFSLDALYVVAWRPRDGLEDAGLMYWLDAIRYRVGLDRCAIFLVSTYCDEGRWSDFDPEQIAHDFYPAIRGYFPVDSATPDGITGLRTALSGAVRALPHYGDAIPESWQRTRELLGDPADPSTSEPLRLHKPRSRAGSGCGRSKRVPVLVCYTCSGTFCSLMRLTT